MSLRDKFDSGQTRKTPFPHCFGLTALQICSSRLPTARTLPRRDRDRQGGIVIAKAGTSTSPTERLHRQGGIVIAGAASTSPRLDRVIAKALTHDDSIAKALALKLLLLQTLTVPYPCRHILQNLGDNFFNCYFFCLKSEV